MAELQIVKSPTGQTTITTVELLEDFWFDFRNFRRDADKAFQNGDIFKVHRYLRAELFSFVCYVNGLTNRWLGKSRNSGSISDALYLAVRSDVKASGLSEPPLEEIAYLESLTKRCADLDPADETKLFEDLAIEKIHSAELKVLEWLRDFAKKEGHDFHAETRSSGLALAEQLGQIRQESYQSVDSAPDDPESFHDDLEGWGPPEELHPTED